MPVIRLALVFAAVTLAAGCTDPASPTDDVDVETFEVTDLSGEESEARVVRAVFVGERLGGDAALVDHEEIPSEDMPAMRMQIALERPDLIAGLAEGDKVAMTLADRPSGVGFVVTAVEPLPADTELDLDGVVPDSIYVPGAE